MTWVKIDDTAFEHPKQLQVGAKAAWLWICCLSYCNRQKRHDGVIPKAKIALLYPGVGLKEARALVAAGLLHEAEQAFVVHGYHEYQPSADLSDKRSMAGKQGGIKSGEARRSKREAIASGSTQAANEPPARPGPALPDPIQPAAEIRELSGLRERPPPFGQPQQPELVPCPRDLSLTVDQIGTLETSGVQREAIAPLTAKFIAKHISDPDDKRTLKVWRKSLVSAVSGDWNDPRRRPKPPGAEQHERNLANEARPVSAATRALMGNLVNGGRGVL